MIAKTYKCEDCPASAEFTSYKKARASGWAVSKDYKTCYCPRCAPYHRLGGATAKNGPAQVQNGLEQLTIKI